MKLLVVSLAVLLLIVNFTNGVEDKKIVRARIDSCPGCSLNRLAEVRAFIYDDVPKYEDVEWKKITGAPPELIFLNEADEEVERHRLQNLNRKACNELLLTRGFKIKENSEEDTKEKEL